MSKNRLGVNCLVLAFLFSGVEPLTAQGDPGSQAEELGARIEALRPLVDDAARRVEVEEQAYLDSVRAVRQIPQDTVMVGPFKVVTVAGQGPLARGFFEPHVAKIAPIIRGSEDLFQGHVWEFFYGWGGKPIFAEGEEVHHVRLSRRHSRERVDRSIEESLAIALYQVLPADAAGFRKWATARSLFPEDDLSRVYRALAFNHDLAGVRCLEDPVTCGHTGRDGSRIGLGCRGP
jgi:hypothetical protein